MRFRLTSQTLEFLFGSRDLRTPVPGSPLLPSGSPVVATSPEQSGAELRPLSIGELTRLIEERCAARKRLRLVGGRTSQPLVLPAQADREVLSMTGLSRVVDYPARDMTITVEAGIRVDDLQRTLRDQGQTLPVDIPETRRATLGGAIATNTCGPGRYGHGSFRDYLIGVRAVDGQGRLFAAGGRVVKNVAGYDLCKLLVGSRGMLAAIAEVTLKLRPLPESRRIVWASLSDWAAGESILDSLVATEARPTAIEVLDQLATDHLSGDSRLSLSSGAITLCVAVEGTESETIWQIDALTRQFESAGVSSLQVLDAADSQTLWNLLVEYQTASDEPVTFQASLLPSQTVSFAEYASSRGIATQTHAGNGIVIGHLPDNCTEAGQAAALLRELQAMARASSGSLRLLRCEPEWWQDLDDEFGIRPTPLEQRICAAFDPQGVFSPANE